MEISENHITEALKIWDGIDDDNLEAAYLQFSKEQPILVAYLQNSLEDYDISLDLEDELLELAYIIYVAFIQQNKNLPKITEQTIEMVEKEEEANHFKILKKLGVADDADEETQMEAMENFNSQMMEAMEKSEEDLKAFVKKLGMEDLLEKMFNNQPVLEGYIQHEISQLEDAFDDDELGLAYNLLSSYITILSKANDKPNLKLV